MKLNLLLGTNNILSGYVNLDLFSENKEGVVCHDFTNLDKICENAECEEIIADNILGFFSSKDVDKLLTHWITKLRHKGKIIISGVDLQEVCRLFYYKQIDLITTNTLLYGKQEHQGDFIRSALNLSELVKALEGFGLKIIKKSYHNTNFIVEAVRP